MMVMADGVVRMGCFAGGVEKRREGQEGTEDGEMRPRESVGVFGDGCTWKGKEATLVNVLDCLGLRLPER